MAPPPMQYVQRPAEYEQLIALLTTTTRHNHVAICAALRGAGGYGKTTLAQAVCQDDRIRAAYPGVAIVALTTEPWVHDDFLRAGADAVLDKRDLRGLVAALVAVAASRDAYA